MSLNIGVMFKDYNYKEYNNALVLFIYNIHYIIYKTGNHILSNVEEWMQTSANMIIYSYYF